MSYRTFFREEYNQNRKKTNRALRRSYNGQRRCAVRGREIMNRLNERRTDKDRFVRWWRKEEDFLDYDLIDRFMRNTSESEEIGGIDLLTMDEMWSILKKVGGARVKLVHDAAGDRVEWVHKSKEGVHTDVCGFTPESLIAIFDAETRGNPVDS